MWQFKEVIEGIAEACSVFNIPITGGNVSFYNETEGKPIHPTPVIGIVGIIEDVQKTLSPGFKEEGNFIVLLGQNKEEIGASEYLKSAANMECGLPPQIDLEEEKRVLELCREAISLQIIKSAHDVSEGGLSICVAESCFLNGNKFGCELELKDSMRTDALLFGETQSRIVVSIQSHNLNKLIRLADKRKVLSTIIGKTGGNNIIIRHQDNEVINIPVTEGYQLWKECIPSIYKITQ